MPNWYMPSTVENIQPLPWLSPEATEYLNNLLHPDMTVLEHGSGGSTLWLAERVKHVTAVEKSKDWYNALSKRIPNNVRLILGSGVIPLAPVDLLFIDGEPVENRATWIQAAPQLVKAGGWLVLDNANRPEYAKERKGLERDFVLQHTVNGNSGAHLYLITEFYESRK